ncbi:uncharacterized protein LOC116015873 [Ipomoea triloba]|uniref:uncharacterized protein LOC116015873 n=1 Tax=Ipomoea triloba TaxID=35885 RepID=UPI00125D9786|nr:uncharacterized protein LOC116015873 [Ipomoea triloba]
MALDDEEEGFEPVGEGVGVIEIGGEESWVVVGHFLTVKLVKVEFMRQVLASVWQPVNGVQVTELQPNLFLFIFYHKSDMVRVLEKGLWSFENNTLVCRQVRDGVLPGNLILDSVDMWLQIGNFIGGFVRCGDRFAGVPWRTLYRIRVSIPVARPLRRGMKLVKRDKTTCWVSFKYERLHTYYFFCGLLWHSYKFYVKARDSPMPLEQYLYGAG